MTEPSPPAEGPVVTTYEGRPLPDPNESVFDQGLSFDLETLVDRRHVLRLIGSAGITLGAFALSACLPTSRSSPGATGTAAATLGATPSAPGTVGSADCDAPIPEETGGPFPGDGSNGPNVLTESGIVRSDITTSFGSMSGTAEGVPLEVRLAIQDLANGCAPWPGAAVYAWHCTREGGYSLYSAEVVDQNFLRGVAETDADGIASFQSIFPGCYSGRWPHIHFEVYSSLAAATDQANRIATSQIALPQDTCDLVYATAGYEASVANLARVSLDADMVFGEDRGTRQLGTVTGDPATGLTVSLAVPVSA